ncbi:MAG TPA: nucleoside deaminase [Firmicutes bacterium]|nr:nucleoside deaminase [Bacillota bacterium]
MVYLKAARRWAVHEKYMREAVLQAKEALAAGEVPIGAVVVLGGEIIGRGRNRREELKDPTAHAEIIAIRAAAKYLGGWRLTAASLYVTLEPCPMCAGAIVNARLKTLVFGAFDPKAGAVSSLLNLVQDERLNHRVDVVAGVCQEECAKLLRDFFKQLR